MKKILAVFIASILLAPAYVGAQSSGIVLLDSFGEFSKGDSVFIYGNAGLPEPDSYLILKITNPRGDICQIQQILPLQDGTFVMDKVPLRGNVCGLDGLYEIEVFYGYKKSTATFSVSSDVKSEPTDSQYVVAAAEYVSQVIENLRFSESENAPFSNDLRLHCIFKDAEP